MQTEVKIPEMADAMVNGMSVQIVLSDASRKSAKLQNNAAIDTRPRLGRAPVRMLILVDSTVCGSCKVSRIKEFQLVVDHAKNIHGGFEPIFIFAPSKNRDHDLRLALMGHPFEWPVFIDTEQKFLKANPHIPKNKALHTFLLDKNNRVVLVGDPIGNDKLWGLYMKTIRQLIDNGGILPEESSGKHCKK